MTDIYKLVRNIKKNTSYEPNQPGVIPDLKLMNKVSSQEIESKTFKRAVSLCREIDLNSFITLLRQEYIQTDRQPEELPTEQALVRLANKNKLVVGRSGVRRALQYLKETNEISNDANSRNVTGINFHETLKLKSSLLPFSRQYKKSFIEVDKTMTSISREVMKLLKCQNPEDILCFRSIRSIYEGEHGNDYDLPVLTSQHFCYAPRSTENTLDREKLIDDVVSKNSISQAFASQNITWRRQSTGVTARLPDQHEVSKLKIGFLDPVMIAKGVNIAEHNNHPIEVTISIFPAHRWELICQYPEIAILEK